VKNRFNFPIQTPIALVIAVLSGVTMLVLSFTSGSESGLQKLILNWVMLMAAAAVLIGVINLTSVHAKKVVEGKGLINSFALIAATVVTFALKFLDTEIFPAEWILSYLIIPVESALMGVLAITLTYAAVRLVSQRPNVYSVLFVISVVLTLAAGTAFGLEIAFFQQTVKPFITHVLASAGARGILIGVALGTITTGLRIIMGFDRPYGG
jgi:hypothetical protein